MTSHHAPPMTASDCHRNRQVGLMTSLLSRHPSCIPFLIYISNEAKHRERFAVRSKYMTLEPMGNRYIRHFDAIRVIQRALTKDADQSLLPKVNWAPASAIECRRVPLSAIASHRVPSSTIECHCVPSSAIECRRVPLSADG